MKFIELFKKDGITPDWKRIFKIPEFKAMKKTKQSSRWHNEGNVDVHTKLVVKNMQRYFQSRKELGLAYENWYYIMMMSAAICHDIGKPSTTFFDKEKNDWSCKNHGDVGSKIVRKLFFDEDLMLREKVCYMIRYHMVLHHIFDDYSKVENKLRKMSNGLVSVQDMLILKSCNEDGSICEENNPINCYNTNNKIADLCSSHNYGQHFFNQPYKYESDVDKILDCALNTQDSFVGKVSSQFTIYVMIGLHGSGKDHYIKGNLSNLNVVCKEDIRKKIGIKGLKPFGNKKQEETVTNIFNNLIDKLCKEGQSFVINDTNLTKKHRLDIIKRVIKYNPKITYIYVEAPTLEENKERLRGIMSLSVVDNLLNVFDFPDYTECSELITSKQKNHNKIIAKENKLKKFFKRLFFIQ